MQVDEGAIPQLVVTGGASQALAGPRAPPRALRRRGRRRVRASARRAGAAAALTYSWSVAGCPSLASTSADPRYFKLDAYTLAASTTYAVAVTVVDARGRNNTAGVALAVGACAVVALLAGGGARSVGASEGLALDASGSYDPDDDSGATGAAGGLAFAWACEGDDAAGRAACASVRANSPRSTRARPAPTTRRRSARRG